MAQTTAVAILSDQIREEIEPMLPSSNRILVVNDEARRDANREPSSFPMSLIGRPGTTSKTPSKFK